MSIVNPEFE